MKAIGAVLAGIGVFDTWLLRSGHASLSEEFGVVARTHPVITSAVTAYLLAHLYGVLPLDPLRGYGYLNRRSADKPRTP